ncbi:MAG: S24 family peptidase [Oscillospiraceae bacterium]
MTFGERLRSFRREKKLTQKGLAELIGAKHNSVSNWENDQNKPDYDTISRLCGVLGVTIDMMMWGVKKTEAMSIEEILALPGVSPLPNMKSVPRLGSIACGVPILASENIEGYDFVDSGLQCDFTLVCRGNSMETRLFEGDVVFIRSQSDVDNGQIAAVLIGEEATLKRVHRSGDSLILTAENPAFPPMIFTGQQLEEIRIIGKAIGFVRYM